MNQKHQNSNNQARICSKWAHALWWMSYYFLVGFALQCLSSFYFYFAYEPPHEKTCLCHKRTTNAQISLRIRVVCQRFAVRCLECIIPLVSISESSSLYLASVAVQAAWSLFWSQTLKIGFLMTRPIWKKSGPPDGLFRSLSLSY